MEMEETKQLDAILQDKAETEHVQLFSIRHH